LRVYADTSVVASLYLPDANAAGATQLIARLRPVIELTPIGELELSNAVELRVFRNEMSVTEAGAVMARIESHIELGFLQLKPMPQGAYAYGRRLVERHTASIGARTLDILHVASASLLAVDRFLTFDQRQRTLAVAAWLKVN
jgi:hypothetical protein